MDFRTFKVNDGSIDSVSRYELKHEDVEAAVRKVNEIQNLPIENVKRTGSGYCFIGPYDISLGEFVYSEEDGEFKLHVARDAKDLYVKAEKKEKQNRATRKFVIEKVFPIGIVICLVATGFIAYIRSLIKGNNISLGNGKEVVDTVDSAAKGVQISDFDPAILIAWADHAVSEYKEDIDASEYRDSMMGKYNDCDDYWTEMHSSFEVYLEYVKEKESLESLSNADGLSDDDYQIDAYINKSYTEFLNYLTQLNDILPNNYRFENSMYAQAIIIEEYDENTHVYENKVYLPLGVTDSSSYSVNNLPEGAIIKEGKLYVPASYFRNLDKGFGL